MNVRAATTFVAAALAALASLGSNAHGAHALTSSQSPRVHPGVHRALRQHGTVNLMITMRDSNHRALASVRDTAHSTRSGVDRAAKIEHLVDALQTHASASHADIKKLLLHESAVAASSSTPTQPLFASFKTYWISNQIYVEAASYALLEKLVALPTIAEVREEDVAELGVSESSNSGSASSGSGSQQVVAAAEWGVEQIGAPALWAKGVTGEGVVIGSIDSGVRVTHESLARNFVGDHGWFAPPNHLTLPSDKSGHGTHTMGTIVGRGGIGVAPGANWMSCRGCPSGLCAENYLLTCFEFMMCPTDTNGENRDCSKAPHVVNNSWSSPAGKKTYAAAIDAWLAAGIIPVFASGNTGPACGSTRSPGDYSTVISVGSTAMNGSLALSSSKGPAFESRLTKPDVSAPGVLIRSAAHDSDAGYAIKSGTSMATPHVVGAIALLLSAKPELRFDEIRTLLAHSADHQSLAPLNVTCSSSELGADRAWPNNNYGAGRVNVLNAYTALMSASH